MNFISTRKENSVFDEMKARLYHQKLMETNKAYSSKKEGELEETLDMIESDYTFNLFKIDEIASLASKETSVQRKFLEYKLYVEKKKASEKAKIQTILTSAAILSCVNTKTENLSLEQLDVLASAMIPIALENYNVYGNVLSHPTLLSSIISKTDDMDERLRICDELIAYCDNCSYDGINDIKYALAIKDSLSIVSKFEILSRENVK